MGIFKNQVNFHHLTYYQPHSWERILKVLNEEFWAVFLSNRQLSMVEQILPVIVMEPSEKACEGWGMNWRQSVTIVSVWPRVSVSHCMGRGDFNLKCCIAVRQCHADMCVFGVLPKAGNIFQKEACCKGAQNRSMLFHHKKEKLQDNEIQTEGAFGLQLVFIWSVFCEGIHGWERPVKCATYNMRHPTLPKWAVWCWLTSERRLAEL